MTERKTASFTVDSKTGTGDFRATIATFNVVDKDGDVTFPGAFPDGREIVVSAYGHTSWSGMLPVGKGMIGADESRAYITGRFFLDSATASDTYQTIRHLGPLAQWSYGYDVLLAVPAGAVELRDYPGARRGLLRLDVHEASPVLLGAGRGTRTDYIKRAEISEQERVAWLALRDDYYRGVREHALGILERRR